MTDQQITLFFEVLSECLGNSPSSLESSEMIVPAYQTPEIAFKPAPDRDMIYYDLVPESLQEFSKQYFTYVTSRNIVRTKVMSFDPYRLNVICYGEHADNFGNIIRSFFMLDGNDLPRRRMRKKGIYPIPDPLPIIRGYEEDGSVWRKRADLSFPLFIINEATYNSPNDTLMYSPAVIMHKQ